MKRRQPIHPYTAIINQQQKQLAKSARNQALTWLAQQFPTVFDNTLRIRPLKIGIMKDILQYADLALAKGISKSKLRQAVVLYTRSIEYLVCLKAQETRVDLHGNPTYLVTATESKIASYQIKKITDNYAFRKHSGQDLSENTGPIIITHKTSKTYDPDAVARLKAKLGL